MTHTLWAVFPFQFQSTEENSEHLMQSVACFHPFFVHHQTPEGRGIGSMYWLSSACSRVAFVFIIMISFFALKLCIKPCLNECETRGRNLKTCIFVTLAFVITVSGKSWKCYVCDSTPLKPLVSYCSSVLEFVENLQEKGNITVASARQKRRGGAKADLSSASTSAAASDVDFSVFSGGNVPEVVKLLKSALEPLQQVIAETEELLVKDLPSADSTGSQQKYESVAAKLKSEFIKSAHALSAVKQTKLPSDVRNCSVDVERLDPGAPVSRSRRIGGNNAVDADSKLKKEEDCGSSRMSNSVNSSSRASRADIEAQRDLHQQSLKDESSESDTGSSSESSTSEEEEEDMESSSSDDDDEYDPKSDIRQVKFERGRERRTTAKKVKMRAGNLLISSILYMFINVH